MDKTGQIEAEVTPCAYCGGPSSMVLDGVASCSQCRVTRKIAQANREHNRDKCSEEVIREQLTFDEEQ